MHRRTLEIASRRWGSVTWSIVMGLGLLQTRFAHGCLRDTTLQKWKADCAGLAECSRPGRDYLQLRGVDVEHKNPRSLKGARRACAAANLRFHGTAANNCAKIWSEAAANNLVGRLAGVLASCDRESTAAPRSIGIGLSSSEIA